MRSQLKLKSFVKIDNEQTWIMCMKLWKSKYFPKHTWKKSFGGITLPAIRLCYRFFCLWLQIHPSFLRYWTGAFNYFSFASWLAIRLWRYWVLKRCCEARSGEGASLPGCCWFQFSFPLQDSWGIGAQGAQAALTAAAGPAVAKLHPAAFSYCLPFP